MTRFPSLEVSSPEFERDGLRCLTVHSPALGGRGDLTLFVPPADLRRQPPALVILQHGIHGSHWAWALKGGAHVTALDLLRRGETPPLVLAMPSDGLFQEGSGYIRHDDADYEGWIVDDVVDAVHALVPELGGDRRFFLTGLSMGGYGALRLGAKHAGRVRGISAHSAVTRLRPTSPWVGGDLSRLLEREDFRAEADLLRWLSVHRDRLPPLRFDCGRDDELIDFNRELHLALLDLGVAHEFEELPGGHTWGYWRANIERSLRFFAGLV
jgi:enterochelin esterase-like enzyme